MNDTAVIRVLIVDDHAVVRTGLRTFFDLQADISVVGEAADGSEGVAMARRLEPDVVLMDLLMPNMDGITAIGRIKAERPEIEIVTMTSFIEEEKVTAAIEAGASGYVLKRIGNHDLIRTIESVARGESALDPAMVASVFREVALAEKQREASVFSDLSAQELRVLASISDGMTNREIASKLFLGEGTVRNYVSSILGKLGLSNRAEAAAFAVQHRVKDVIGQD